MPKQQVDSTDIWDLAKGLQKIAINHTKMLLEQYKTMKGIYGGQNKVLMDAVMDFWPQETRKFFETFDIWLEQELKIFEENIYEFVDGYSQEISELKIIAPSPDIYRQMVEEHTKLWIDNYTKLEERREQINRDSLESIKVMFPPVVHPILESINQWIMGQNEKMGTELIGTIRKFVSNLGKNRD
jgi:hypothetical protein